MSNAAILTRILERAKRKSVLFFSKNIEIVSKKFMSRVWLFIGTAFKKSSVMILSFKQNPAEKLIEK